MMRTQAPKVLWEAFAGDFPVPSLCFQWVVAGLGLGDSGGVGVEGQCFPALSSPLPLLFSRCS